MLFSLYATTTQHYFLLCLIASLGTLQWSAARHKRLTLSLLGPWALNRLGSLIGIFLIVGGFIWFFAFTPGLFEPGLAGGELSVLFGLGCLCALFITRLSGGVWQSLTSSSSSVPF